MTDLEINKALALAIGWDKNLIDVEVWGEEPWIEIWDKPARTWRVFDYRDWAVIGPIAERYNAFPWRTVDGWVSVLDYRFENTPQRAIALAVIEARK